MTAHSFDFPTSICKSSLSWLDLIIWQSFASSTNSLIKHLTTLGKSFIKIKNRIGPSTLPCGIPDVMFLKLECAPFTITRCFLLFKNSYIHLKTTPLIPYLSILTKSLLWGTLSKALQKSRYMTSSSCLWSMAEVISSINSSNCVTQDFPFIKPCCSSQNKLFVVIWFTSASLIIISIILPGTVVKLIGL